MCPGREEGEEMSIRTKYLLVPAAALALTVPAAAVGTATAAPAREAGCCNPSITVRVSDSTPASGQTFRIRGRFLRPSGRPAAHQIVKVQTRRGDRWVRIRGARMRTDDRGRYRMRLILLQRGRRVMRVAGVTPAADRRNAFERFIVRVH